MDNTIFYLLTRKKPLLQSGGGDTLISEMKDLLKAAGLKHEKFKHRWEGIAQTTRIPSKNVTYY